VKTFFFDKFYSLNAFKTGARFLRVRGHEVTGSF
jgi:hypothetical protein